MLKAGMTLTDRLERYLAKSPNLHPTVFIARGAAIIGDVQIGARSSVWFNSVLRGDIQSITIGEGTNIQDGTIIHLENNIPAVVGNYVTVGHRALLHACTVEDEVLVGMGAIILDGAKIGSQSIIGAQALVTKNTEIPPRSLVIGAPAKVVRQLRQEEIDSLRPQAEKYAALGEHYLKGGYGLIYG